MRRREYLATMGAFLAVPFAGCAHSTGVLQLDEVSDEGIADRASRDVSENVEARHIVTETVTNGTSTASGRSPPLEPGKPVIHENRYYAISVRETGQRDTATFSISVDYDPQETPAGSTITVEDLPSVDRAALDHLIPPHEDAPRGEGMDFGIDRAYAETEMNQSVLVPEQEHEFVRYQSEVYMIQVGDPRDTTVFEYEYEADELAANATEFADIVRTEYRFSLAGLSAAEREIVEDAIDNGYYEDDPTDAFESLVGRLRDQPALTNEEGGGEWLVRYNDTEYWATLRYPPSIVEQ